MKCIYIITINVKCKYSVHYGSRTKLIQHEVKLNLKFVNKIT